MGWQDRDWAKLDRSEFEAIYGRTSGGPSTWGRSGSSTVRRGAGAAILVSLLATLALGRLHVLNIPPLHRAGAQPVVYGQPLQDGSVCTHLKSFPGSGWKCLEARIGLHGVRVVVPPRYDGTCTELIADQASGRWTCLGPAA